MEPCALRPAGPATAIIRFEGFDDSARLVQASASADGSRYLYNIVEDTGVVGRFFLVSESGQPLNQGASDYVFA